MKIKVRLHHIANPLYPANFERQLLISMKGKYTFTAQIEKDSETGLNIGYIPSLPGAYTQAATLDELQENLEEVASLCLKELSVNDFDKIQSAFVGTQQIMVTV